MFESTEFMQDENGDGYLSFDELRQALENDTDGVDPSISKVADEAMKALDVSGDGFIEYHEFLAAAIDRRRILTDHTLAELFGRANSCSIHYWARLPIPTLITSLSSQHTNSHHILSCRSCKKTSKMRMGSFSDSECLLQNSKASIKIHRHHIFDRNFNALRYVGHLQHCHNGKISDSFGDNKINKTLQMRVD